MNKEKLLAAGRVVLYFLEAQTKRKTNIPAALKEKAVAFLFKIN
jgi:acyl-CoA thioesterase FadM